MAALDIIKLKDFKEIEKLFKRQVDTDAQAEAVKQYNIDTHDVFDKLCLPFKIRAVTTRGTHYSAYSKLCLPFKIRAVTTEHL